MKMFAMFVKFSHEKNMADIIFFRSTVSSYRISNEVRRDVSVLTALLTSWGELSIFANCLFSVSIFIMYIYTLLMPNFGFENRERWPTRLPSFLIKNILVQMKMDSDWFTRIY